MFCFACAVWLRFAAVVCWRSAAFFFDDTVNGLFLKLGCTLLLLVRFYIICVGVLVFFFFYPSYLGFKRFYDVLYGFYVHVIESHFLEFENRFYDKWYSSDSIVIIYIYIYSSHLLYDIWWSSRLVFCGDTICVSLITSCKFTIEII